MEQIEKPFESMAPSSYLMRSEMLTELSDRGWSVDVDKDSNTGEVGLKIDCLELGTCIIGIPRYSFEDHRSRLEEIYYILGSVLENHFGIIGNC